ncbi:MAG: hypothetical protein OXU72_16900, partial [Gammaproteobacteria bacterium]|nr:hypothetical protein [Gammaproteobacteria bacterium]
MSRLMLMLKTPLVVAANTRRIQPDRLSWDQLQLFDSKEYSILHSIINLNSEFACGASISAHGHIILLYSRFSDEL